MKNKGYNEHQRKEIKQRDGYKCFFENVGICESGEELTIGHIFVWRKDGGKPVKENGVCICRKCHDKMDFGLGVTIEQQKRMLRYVQMYLTFFYFREITNEEVTIGGKVKTRR